MEKKHQLLATRLGEILGRFNNGETLYVKQRRRNMAYILAPLSAILLSV